MNRKLLQVNDLKKYYSVRSSSAKGKQTVYAVDGVSFEINRGETLSLVGESGCGKSTVGRAILGLSAATSGQIILNGARIDDLSVGRFRPLRKTLQVVFQDPYSSLNPRMRVRDLIEEPIRNFGTEVDSVARSRRVSDLLDRVGLPKEAAGRFPHEFSGGQRQRIGIARALATYPEIIVCDEAVSALDVSVKAQIVNLLQDLQKELGLALLFISHDLAIVEHLTHHVAVMYLGKLMENGPRRSVFTKPLHPYTKALLAAVPVADPLAKRTSNRLTGEVPSPMNPPSGCRFRTRCPHVQPRCAQEEPLMRPIGDQWVACHFAEVIEAGQGA
jgi:peptide/nickel transport system ATP-binding protein